MLELKDAVARQQNALLQTLQESIRIPSVRETDASGAPYGAKIRQCLHHTLDAAEKLGFSVSNMNDQVGWCEYGSGAEMVAVLGHLDVVPAGDGWCGNPFSGDIQDGKIYGRGSVDDKGPAIAALYALNALKESGLKLHRRIRILFGTNEETGAADMKYYLAHGGELPKMGFTPDGEYPVINGEKGIVNVTYQHSWRQDGPMYLTLLRGGEAPNVVPASAVAELKCSSETAEQLCVGLPDKVSCTQIPGGVRLEARGVSAHGSTPEEGENAIGRLLLALGALLPAGETGDALRFLGEKIGMETDGSALGIALHDDVSGGLTLNLGTIQGDETGVRLCMNYRYPVTKQLEDCAPILQKAFESAGFTTAEQVHKKSLYIPESSTLVQTLLGVYSQMTGLPAKPKSIGGGTYAKSLPNIVAFGPIFPGDEVREHKPDEFIEIEQLMKNAQIIAQAMYQLAK